MGILDSILNTGLDTNSFIIMDEPEVHLHPSWQMKLAEIIVILSKHDNINFYINSHSPQFIEAIEVFSEKYGLKDNTNFFITKENGKKFDFIKIDRNHLKALYRDLSGSYTKIAKIRAENFSKSL